jgi:hypothetical protein
MANKKLQHILYPDFWMEVSRGTVPKYDVVHKFGRNPSVGTTFEPITTLGTYWTPTADNATTVRVKAGNANDAPGGTGARAVTITGIDANGDRITEELATGGASAGPNSTQSFMRVDRLWVSESGTYATNTEESHAGDIVIENSAGTVDIAAISATGWARGQSQIGVYTIPAGQTGYIKNAFISVDSTKTVDISLYKREGVTTTTAPFDAIRLLTEQNGVTGISQFSPSSPVNGLVGPCDIGFMAKTSAGTASVTADFEIVLVTTAQGV